MTYPKILNLSIYKVLNILVKKQNSGDQHFSPFLTMFSKAILLTVTITFMGLPVEGFK